MSDNATVRQPEIEQAKVSMAEIAMMALTAKDLAAQVTMDVGGDPHAISLINAIHVISEKIGFLADLCLDKLGDSFHIGDAEAWMLPPSYHEAKSKD